MQSRVAQEDTGSAVTDVPLSILVFGFSVTADKAGYGIYLADALKCQAGRAASIDICGIGGVDIEFATVTITDILARKHYDIILLDILTGQDRALRLATDRFMECYRSLLAKISRQGCMPVVLELYRGEVDLRRDNIRHAVLSLNQHLAIPTLSLFESTRDRQAEAGDLLKDTVHTTDAGAFYYAQQVSHFLVKDVFPRFAPTAPFDLPDTCHCLLAAHSSAEGLRQNFSRTGYTLECIKIMEGNFVDIPLPKPTAIIGCSYVMGPDAGELSVGVPDSPFMRSVITVDKYSYYHRVHSTVFEPIITQIVRVTQVGPRPEVTLSKGSFIPGATVGRIGHLIFSS
jgi:hypothetical protein